VDLLDLRIKHITYENLFYLDGATILHDTFSWSVCQHISNASNVSVQDLILYRENLDNYITTACI